METFETVINGWRALAIVAMPYFTSLQENHMPRALIRISSHQATRHQSACDDRLLRMQNRVQLARFWKK